MAKKPKVGKADLYEIATYLARPEVKTEIHAEMPPRSRAKFEKEYAVATNGYPLPQQSSKKSYFVLDSDADKQGKELRIYFQRVAPEPPPIQDLYTDKKKWRDGYRINHSNLVMQLFECGFVLGANEKNGARIKEFMSKQFPVPPDKKKP